MWRLLSRGKNCRIWHIHEQERICMKTRFSSLKTAAAGIAAVAACVAFSPVMAQDGETAEETAAEETPAAEGEGGAAEGAAKPKAPAKLFFGLIRCNRANGEAQALKPGSADWEQVIEGKYYPLGTSFRTVETLQVKANALKLEIGFGAEAEVTIEGEGEFGTKLAEFGTPDREVLLKAGKIKVDLPRTAKEGALTVTAPYFSGADLAGESTYEYKATGDGDEAVVRCVTGTMRLAGANFRAARLAPANQIRIRSTADNLFTSLRGESGDCKLQLDQGVVGEKNFETGEVKDVPKELEFVLSPKCAVKIFRAKSEVGGRMIVSTMTFDATGRMKNRCTFAEKRSNVNTGELVVPEKIDADDKQKSADDAAEEVEAVDATEAGGGAAESAESAGSTESAEADSGSDEL